MNNSYLEKQILFTMHIKLTKKYETKLQNSSAQTKRNGNEYSQTYTYRHTRKKTQTANNILHKHLETPTVGYKPIRL